MLHDHGLCQLVNVPTHRRGHTLHWVVVRSEGSLLSMDRVMDCAGLSDHYLAVCGLTVTKSPPLTRLVTSMGIRAVCLSVFQAGVKVLAESTEQCSDLHLVCLVDAYNVGLQQLLDRHAPSVTRRVRGRPLDG